MVLDLYLCIYYMRWFKCLPFFVYFLLENIISGTFGQVLECLDNEKKEIVAIKVVRSIHKYREAAMIEIDVLQKLSRHDVGGKR